MKTEVRVGCSSTGVRKKLATLVIALAILGLCGGKSIAGDLSAQPVSGINVIGATGSALPDTPGGGPSWRTEWLSGLHVSGYLSQTVGIWQNPSGLADFTTSRNSLATSRTLLQLDENLRINEHNSLFMREWFVYEPPYAFNSANTGTRSSSSLGQYGNEFYNQYNVRDAWWENKTGPLTTYVGNQIVVWGQSLAFRLGDVINPQDTTWAFGFANLEQSRIPQWMVHPILNLPTWGPLSSNFLEGILIPRLQPMWNSCDYADHRYDGGCNVNAGTVNNGAPAGVGLNPSGRFGAHINTHYYPGVTATLVLPGGIVIPPFSPRGEPLQNNHVFGTPFANAFFYCKNLGSQLQPHNPVPAALQRNCSGTGFDIGQWKVPATTVANWNEGIRFHTLIGGVETTAFYYNAWNLYPNLFWQPYTMSFRLKFLPETMVGVTADTPLPMPSSVSEYFPFVGRAEGVYANHQGIGTWDVIGSPSGVRYSDSVNWMLALDLDSAYAPWLTSTGNLTANFELYDHIPMDAGNSTLESTGPWTGGGLETESSLKNNISLLFNIGTSWLWEDIVPTWTMVFSPKGRTFLLFPSLVLNPPWTKKYFMKLQAIEVFGGDNAYVQGGGVLKGQSLLTAQFQYNFNLL
jgi:hypothetical protein